MDTETSIKLSVLKFVTGDNSHVCRLCFASTEEHEFDLYDTVKLERPFLNEDISYFDMFIQLGVSTDLLLPNIVCVDCAATTINSYLFWRLCQYSNKKWSEALHGLDKALLNSELFKENIGAAYFMIENNNSMVLTTRKIITKSKAAALQRFRHILINKSKKKRKVKTIICDECGVTCTTRHMKVHNKPNSNRYPCPHCTKYFATKPLLREHAERVHHPKIVHCSQCAKMFGSERMLIRHVQTHHTAAICKLCFIQFPSKNALRAHLDKHDVNTCHQCNKQFLTKQTFKIHLKICGKRSKQPNFFCDICNRGYIRKNGIRTHLKTVHGFGRVHSCSWCNKKYDAMSRLKNHIVKHTRERNFLCVKCGGKFVTKAALIYHVRLHTGERPFPCDMCNESFLSASRRMEHKKRKHLEPTKECFVCHYKCVTTHQLKKHVERHYNPQSKLYVADTVSLIDKN